MHARDRRQSWITSQARETSKLIRRVASTYGLPPWQVRRSLSRSDLEHEIAHELAQAARQHAIILLRDRARPPDDAGAYYDAVRRIYLAWQEHARSAERLRARILEEQMKREARGER